MNFASSDMRSGVQGGSHVSSSSTLSTSGKFARVAASMSSWIIGPAGQPIDVSVCVTLTFGPSTSTS